MRYKKDPWYIAGLIIIAVAALAMLVTMVFMYYGSNAAIIWFFAACPVLVVGFFLSQSVRRRYEDADAINGEPLPMFWRIRFGFHNLKVLVITKGLWRVIFTFLTILSLAVTLTFGVLWGYSVISKNSVLNHPTYIENEQKHEEYRILWNQARADKDEEKAHEYFAVMEECNKENYNSRKHIEDCEEAIKFYVPLTAVFGALTVFFAVILSAYLLKKRQAARLEVSKEPSDEPESDLKP